MDHWLSESTTSMFTFKSLLTLMNSASEIGFFFPSWTRTKISFLHHCVLNWSGICISFHRHRYDKWGSSFLHEHGQNQLFSTSVHWFKIRISWTLNYNHYSFCNYSHWTIVPYNQLTMIKFHFLRFQNLNWQNWHENAILSIWSNNIFDMWTVPRLNKN